MAMLQCCHLAKVAKRPSHTTNTMKFDRIPFDPCNSIKRFDLCPFDQKNSTYLQPPDNGYIFQPVALEVQGSSGESSEIFITRLCKMLCRSHDDQRAGSFLKQRISMALQIGNAACVLGTVSDRDAFEEIHYI